jgi:hypothetical protein
VTIGRLVLAVWFLWPVPLVAGAFVFAVIDRRGGAPHATTAPARTRPPGATVDHEGGSEAP